MSKKTRPTLDRDTRGAVYVEFLLAFIPLFFMFLGMVQMGLLYGASLVVQHSSNVAARAAMVVMDDDPACYDGEARREVNSSASGFSSFVQRAGSALGSIFGSSSSSPVGWQGGARQQAIEFAASMPLLPISPSFSSITRMPQDESVRGALGLRGLDTPEARVAWGLVYNRMAMAVTFPQRAGSTDHRTAFDAPSGIGDGGQITTRVTYLYNCQVPLANRLMCEDLSFIQFGFSGSDLRDLANQFSSGAITWDQLQASIDAYRIRNARRDRWQSRMNELGQQVNVLAGIVLLSGLAGGPVPRFVPITAEATMPMQSANYRYHSGSEPAGCSGGSDSTGWEQQSDD